MYFDDENDQQDQSSSPNLSDAQKFRDLYGQNKSGGEGDPATDKGGGKQGGTGEGSAASNKGRPPVGGKEGGTGAGRAATGKAAGGAGKGAAGAKAAAMGARGAASAAGAAASGGTSLAVQAGVEALRDPRGTLKKVIIIVTVIILLFLIPFFIIMAILGRSNSNRDSTSTRTQQYINLSKSVLVCDLNAQNCSSQTTDVKGEKLLIFSISVSPKSYPVSEVTLKDIFREGIDKLQPNFLRIGLGSDDSFFDSEVGIDNVSIYSPYKQGCPPGFALNNICLNVKNLTSQTNFTITVKTLPSFTQKDPVVNEVSADGLVEFTGGSINPSCLWGYAQRPLGSMRLGSIFSEASAASGIPVDVIEAVASHELPNFFYNANDDHDAFSIGFQPINGKDVYVSTDGAGTIGIMQVSPPGGIGYCAACIQKGAEFLGRSFNEINSGAALRDVRTNVFVGAGYLAVKFAESGGKNWEDMADVQRAVRAYNGSGAGAEAYGRSVAGEIGACRALTQAPKTN